jgi:hypothetical protein
MNEPFEKMIIVPPQNPWARISELAARLGVEPVEHKKIGTITAVGEDGNSYDLWEVVIAFLNRMEKDR